MRELSANNAFTTLTSAIATTPAAGTSEAWAVASTAAPFPQPVTGVTQFRAAVSPLSPVDTNPEILLVTAINDATHFQVTRGAEGSTVKTHASGDQLTCVQTSGNTALNADTILATVGSVNAFSTGLTALFTVPSGYTAVVTGAVVRCTAASAVTNGPTLGVEVVSGTYDIYASTNLVALTTTMTIFGFQTVGMSRNAAAASVINLRIGTSAVGTSQTIAVDLLGYLV